MVKNRYLSRSIIEQQWGKIKEQLTYKAESAGGNLTLHPSHYTTITCSDCGRLNPKLPLFQRVFDCMYCGYSEDRDINAGRNLNILNRRNSVSDGKVDFNQFPMSAEKMSAENIKSKEVGDRGTLHSEQYI